MSAGKPQRWHTWRLAGYLILSLVFHKSVYWFHSVLICSHSAVAVNILCVEFIIPCTRPALLPFMIVPLPFLKLTECNICIGEWYVLWDVRFGRSGHNISLNNCWHRYPWSLEHWCWLHSSAVCRRTHAEQALLQVPCCNFSKATAQYFGKPPDERQLGVGPIDFFALILPICECWESGVRPALSSRFSESMLLTQGHDWQPLSW